MDTNDLLVAAVVYDEFFNDDKDNALNWLNKKREPVETMVKEGQSFALPIFSGWL